MNKVILLVFACVLLSACRDEVTDEDGQVIAAEVRVLPSNDEVLTKAYNPSYRTPEGFYVDERVDTPGSYSLYHIKDQSVSYELCSDDFGEALAWESADNASRAVNGDFITSVENDRYFEFVRELTYPDSVGNVSDPTSPGFARIFKCSYIDRIGADRNLRDGYAGKFNVIPLTEESIRTYVEYMWQFTFFWPARTMVVDSFSSETPDSYQNTLLLVLVTNRGNDNCDLIELVDWEFGVDKESGQITKSFRRISQLEAQIVDGVPQECTD